MEYIIVLVFLILLSVNVFYFLGVFYKFPGKNDKVTFENTIALIPARNEGVGVMRAVSSLQLQGFKYIYVVANNCVDDTVEVCKKNKVDYLDFYIGGDLNGKDTAIKLAVSMLSKKYPGYNFLCVDSDVYINDRIKEGLRYLNDKFASFPVYGLNVENRFVRLSNLLFEYVYRLNRGLQFVFGRSLAVGSVFYIPGCRVSEFLNYDVISKVEDLERSLVHKFDFIDLVVGKTILPVRFVDVINERLRWFSGWFSIPFYRFKMFLKNIWAFPLFLAFYFAVFQLFISVLGGNILPYLFGLYSSIFLVINKNNKHIIDYLIFPWFVLMNVLLGFLSLFVKVQWKGKGVNINEMG
jgi:hypothetical protein